jgi:hypothetical protein
VAVDFMTRILIPRSDNTSAKTIEASDWEKYWSGDILCDYLICGLTVTAQCPNVLAVDVSSGKARVNGLYLENSVSCSVSCLTACSSNKIYLQVCRDPSCEPEAWTFGKTTGCIPADSFQIATVVTNATTVTSVSQIHGTDVNLYPVTNKMVSDLDLCICNYTTPCSATGSSLSECGTRIILHSHTPNNCGAEGFTSYCSHSVVAVNGACTNSVLNGGTYSQVVFLLKKNTCTVSGTIQARTFDCSGCTVACWDSIAANSLTTCWAEYTFTAPTSCDYWQPVDCTQSQIGLYHAAKSNSSFGTDNAGDSFDGTSTRRKRGSTGKPTCLQTTDAWFKLLHFSACASVDDDLCTHWRSNSEVNPNIYVDMGTAQNITMVAIHPHCASTVCEIKIQTSSDACTWTDLRTITWSNVTEGAWNYIRLNVSNARYLRIYGNDGGSKILAMNQIKVLTRTADQITVDHRHVDLGATNTSIPL